MEACADYLAVKGRRISFEWALIDGVNDRPTRRRRARRAVPPVPPAGARQPDPAQPDARLADRRLAARSGPRVPRPARGARRQRDGPPQPRHRHRRRLRPARRRSAGDAQPVTMTRGTSGWRRPACRAPIASTSARTSSIRSSSSPDLIAAASSTSSATPSVRRRSRWPRVAAAAPSSSSRSTIDSALIATRAWYCSRPVGRRQHVALAAIRGPTRPARPRR